MADDADDLFGEDKFARAVAEGRVVAGMTEDQAREARRIKQINWRAANRDRSREITRDSMKRVAAAKAVAEGREPHKPGRPTIFTEEEKRAKRKAKSEKWNAAHLGETREYARLRGQAVRDGTFVSRALPRLTDEQRRQVNVAMGAARRARVRGVGGKFTAADVRDIVAQQANRCLFCREPLGEGQLHIDHWIPVIAGGTNDPSNIAVLHEACNLKKAAHLPSEFGLPDSPIPLRELLSGSPDCVPIIQEE